MDTKKRTSTSASERALIQRALNQLENVEALLRRLPKRTWKKKKQKILRIIADVENITETTKTELADNT